MALFSNIFRRGGRYWFRVRVPIDLISRVGRGELWRSLRTSDPAMARRKGAEAMAGVASLWEAVRRQAGMTREQINGLIQQFFVDFLDEDAKRRVADKAPFDWRAWPTLAGVWTMEHTPNEVDAIIADSGRTPRDFFNDYFAAVVHDEAKQALAANRWREAASSADALLSEQGQSLDPASTDYRLLCQGILRAVVEGTRLMQQRAAGNWSGKPRDPLLQTPAVNGAPAAAAAAQPQQRRANEPKLTDLLERFLTERTGMTAKSAHDYRAAIRAFDALIGARSVSGLTRKDVVLFKDTLMTAPANWTKRFPNVGLREAAKRGAEAKMPTLSAKTINSKYLAPLSTFLRWCANNDYLTTNPATGIHVEVAKSQRRQKMRLPFSSEHLKAIFAAPLFTGCQSEGRLFEPGTHRVRDHKFWAPLIALYSGGRLNEIGQLTVDDLKQTDGIWCLHFTDAGDEDEKSLKSEAARRVVPVHPELVKLGLLDHAKAMRKQGEARLFPTWQRGGDGYYSSIFSKWFARFLDSVEIKDRRLVFHSFRHTFKDALRAAQVEERIQDALMGHQPDHVSGEYGLGYAPAALAEMIGRVRYASPILSKLPGKPENA